MGISTTKNDNRVFHSDEDNEATPIPPSDEPCNDFAEKSVRKEFLLKYFMMVLFQALVTSLVSWGMYDAVWLTTRVEIYVNWPVMDNVLFLASATDSVA